MFQVTATIREIMMVEETTELHQMKVSEVLTLFRASGEISFTVFLDKLIIELANGVRSTESVDAE